MKDTVLWRKQSQLVMLLSNALNITPEEALDKFYTTDTYKKLSSQKFGLHLMSDMYLLEELIAELSANKKIIVWIGRSGCSHCADYAPRIAEFGTKLNEPIYYIDL